MHKTVRREGLYAHGKTSAPSARMAFGHADPRKVAEAVALSGFDFETKERRRLSQNVGTKRQPAAATHGVQTREKSRRRWR